MWQRELSKGNLLHYLYAMCQQTVGRSGLTALVLVGRREHTCRRLSGSATAHVGWVEAGKGLETTQVAGNNRFRA
jgi:hypothetical protein